MNGNKIPGILVSEITGLILWASLPWVIYHGAEIPDCGREVGESLSEKIWNSNLEIVIAATDPERRSAVISKFSSAVLFFERVTGVQSDTMTFAGRLPSSSLPKTIETWKEWFEDNRELPNFHIRICRAFKNIQMAEEELEKERGAVPGLIGSLWVHPSAGWGRILSYAEHGKVTIRTKLVKFSANGEFAFVICAVTIEGDDSYYFVEIDRNRGMLVYLGDWAGNENGHVVAQYRLYEASPELMDQSYFSRKHADRLAWSKDNLRFRQVDFFPVRYIPLPSLRMQFTLLVSGVKEQKEFYFRE